jgi:hypothetical protein
MDKVYIILQKDLKENRTSIYDVYSDKKLAKRIVDKLNKQNAYDVEDQEVDYILESHYVNNGKEEEID